MVCLVNHYEVEQRRRGRVVIVVNGADRVRQGDYDIRRFKRLPLLNAAGDLHHQGVATAAEGAHSDESILASESRCYLPPQLRRRDDDQYAPASREIGRSDSHGRLAGSGGHRDERRSGMGRRPVSKERAESPKLGWPPGGLVQRTEQVPGRFRRTMRQ